jgi:hypothetical protein
MNDYSEPRPGKIEVHGNGLGAPSSEEVEKRAREIAMIDERNPDEFTEGDWKQARRELMGEENNTPPEETPDNADLTELSSPALKVIACHAPASTKRKPSASTSLVTASKKLLTTRCSKRVAKNSNKRERFFEFSFG